MASDTASDTVPGPSTPQESQDLEMKAYEALEGPQVRQVFDTVDSLQRFGLSPYISLPQIIVVGDQSSGKSSVLENITGIPFPRNEGLCTRFATQIIMRRSTKSIIKVKITPDEDCTEEERRNLKAFRSQLKDFAQLPRTIDQATQAMGLGPVGEAGSRQLSKHVLSVEIHKPDMANLTLVDLPGLIHVAGAAPSDDGREDDKTMITNLVHKYMENPRSIILAVVSGKNDYNNQVVLNVWRDPTKSERMLGIITKPDTIAQSDVENWIQLAQNKKEIVLKHGWHMLRNRGPDEMDLTIEECHETEREFFTEGKFTDLSRESVGIHALKDRLSKLLFEHLRKELPKVEREVHDRLKEVVQELEKMGAKRTTADEQRDMLLSISGRVQELIKGATTGYYADSFFRKIDMEAAPDSDENNTRFRAAAQHLNIQFANTMRRQGHKYTLGSGPGDDDLDVAEELQVQEELDYMADGDIGAYLPKPKNKSRAESVAWVRAILVRTRGTELPGSSNPMTVAHLFWEQSEPWKGIAAEHVRQMHNLCKNFVQKVIQHTAPNDILDRLIAQNVDPMLERALHDCEIELSKIVISTQKSNPMTYDKNFTTELQKQRQRKHSRIAQQAAKDSMSSGPYANSRQEIDAIKLEQALSNSVEHNMDKFSAEEALDVQRAYYRQKLNQIIDNVCVYVTERHFVDELPNLVLPQHSIHKMTDEEVQFVAAESRESTERRKDLEQRKAILKRGLEKLEAHRKSRR